ncbi:uncharacterized protein DS421_3g75550 [Arachis hypogaea]|nr:uncharacterized protein DS421_3g75550 [Arachis hypogaea]
MKLGSHVWHLYHGLPDSATSRANSRHSEKGSYDTWVYDFGPKSGSAWTVTQYMEDCLLHLRAFVTKHRGSHHLRFSLCCHQPTMNCEPHEGVIEHTANLGGSCHVVLKLISD